MLGNKSSTADIFFTKSFDRAEKIKKVDIDMFSTGETQETVSRYDYIIQKKDNIFEIDFEDHYTLFLKLILKVNLDKKDVIYATIDEEKSLPYQKDGDSLSADVFLDRKGSHKIVVITQDKETNNRLRFSFDFFVKETSEVKTSNLDIPVDSYRGALLNATKLWLLSTSKDRVRRPDWAGFFDNNLRRYNMNEEGAEAIKKDLMERITAQMPGIYINEVTATPLLNELAWDIGVTSTDIETGITTNREKQNSHIKVSLEENEKVVEIKKY